MTMLISAKINKGLSDQIGNEFYAAHTYLAMSCCLQEMGLKMLSKWFAHHAAEEREHGMKILNYIQDVGGTVTLGPIAKPKGKYPSVEAIIKAALGHELEVTDQINKLMAAAVTAKDYATQSFLQWFVDEQVEEVGIVSEVLDLVKLAGPKNLLQVEARVAKILASEG